MIDHTIDWSKATNEQKDMELIRAVEANETICEQHILDRMGELMNPNRLVVDFVKELLKLRECDYNGVMELMPSDLKRKAYKARNALIRQWLEDHDFWSTDRKTESVRID